MRVAVIGGGIAGLAAAYALRDHAVTVLERDARLGGKVLTERVAGFLLEAGPDSFLSTKPQAVTLAREVGLGGQVVGTRPGRAVFVLSRGRLHPLPDGLMLIAPTRIGPLAASSLFSAWEKARIGADLVLPPRVTDGDVSLGEFVRRRMGKAALDRIAAPLLAGIYAGDADRLSLRATFPQLLDATREHGSLIRGLLARGRAARSVANGNAEVRENGTMFLTIRDGLDLLVERLAGSIRGEIRTGAAVERLERGSRYTLHLSTGERLEADAVILATQAYAAADLLEPLVPEASRLLRAIPYASTATVSLGYREQDLPPINGHGFIVARGEGHRITACTWASSKWPGRAPQGYGLLRAYVGSAADPDALDRSDEEIVRIVREELRDAMSLSAEPVLARVHRWPEAMPQYTVGHLDRLAEIEHLLGHLPGVFLAGAGYRGIGLPDCIAQGRAAAAKI